MDGISITIVFELTNNASIGISIRASVAISTSAACALSDGDLSRSRLPASTTEGWSDIHLATHVS